MVTLGTRRLDLDELSPTFPPILDRTLACSKRCRESVGGIRLAMVFRSQAVWLRQLALLPSVLFLAACPESPCEKLRSFCETEVPTIRSDFVWSCRAGGDWIGNDCDHLEVEIARLEARCKNGSSTESECEERHQGSLRGVREVARTLRALRSLRTR